MPWLLCISPSQCPCLPANLPIQPNPTHLALTLALAIVCLVLCAEDQRKDLEVSVQKLTDDYVKQVGGSVSGSVLSNAFQEGALTAAAAQYTAVQHGRPPSPA